jgi:hypothetical protein
MNTNEFKFYCSRCDHPLKSEAEFAGVHIYCPACKHFFRIPKPSAGARFTHIVPEYVRTRATYVPEGSAA